MNVGDVMNEDTVQELLGLLNRVIGQAEEFKAQLRAQCPLEETWEDTPLGRYQARGAEDRGLNRDGMCAATSFTVGEVT